MIAKLEAASVDGDMTLALLSKQLKAEAIHESATPGVTLAEHDARAGAANNGWLPVHLHLLQAANSRTAIPLRDVLRKEIDILQTRLEVLRGDVATARRH